MLVKCFLTEIKTGLCVLCMYECMHVCMHLLYGWSVPYKNRIAYTASIVTVFHKPLFVIYFVIYFHSIFIIVNIPTPAILQMVKFYSAKLAVQLGYK